MLTCQKKLFSLPEDITYLNCAYMSPMMKTVEDSGYKALLQKRTPHLVSPDDFFENTQRLREAFASLINAPKSEHIAVIPSVSYGIATVIKNIPLAKGDEIILMDEQFPSNYYGWEKAVASSGATIKTIQAPHHALSRAQGWNQNILDSITSKTKVVSMAHVHWADGTLFDLRAIRQATKDVGALLIIDGTQSVGALPFDVIELEPDALICAGYKWLLGPYSIGLAYYGEYFHLGEPIEENWINRKDSKNFSQLVNYQPEYESGAARYSVGEQSNFSLVPMMLEAITQLNHWNPERIQNYCSDISDTAVNQLRSAGFNIEKDDHRGHHLFGIRLPKHLNVASINQQLKENNIYVSVRGNAVRVAPHLYNEQRDFDKLLEILTD